MEFPELSELGLKLDVAPAGKPLTLRATDPLNPPSASTFTVYWMLDPVLAAGDSTVNRKSCPLMVLTLSNVAVIVWDVSCAVTARPTYTLWAMAIVVLPTAVQFTPSGEVYPVIAFPSRVNFTQ